jgi:ribosomal protein S18 acetylase RimI-like enzyme
MIELRDATPADVPALVELAGTTFYDAYKEFDDPEELRDYRDTHLTPDYFRDAIRAPDSHVEVLTDGEQLIAYLLLKDAPGPDFVQGRRPLELARLYLRHNRTGQGFGQRLMERVFAFARKRGFDYIWLQVYDRNVSAIRFYERFGFQQRGVADFRFAGRIYKDPVMVASVTQTGGAR